MADTAESSSPDPEGAAPKLTPVPTRSLGQAVVTALVLVGLIFGAYLIGRTAFFILICTVVTIALYEMLDGITKRGGRPIVPFGLLCGLALMYVAYLERFALVGPVLVATVLGSLVLTLRTGRGPHATQDVAWTMLGVTWLAGGGAGATAILMIGEERVGLHLLIAMILTVALDDIAAYFVGVSFGRHKLAPSVSPAKSWEGFIGGIFGALAGGLLFATLLDELTIQHGLAMGAIVGLCATVGDLVESMFKREVGIKDSSGLLPGHGGLLDRLDAILFCAPIVYMYLRFVAS